jgi:hypothetical protein
MSMPELLVTMVILGIIGVALVRLLMVQTRFFDHQTALRGARAVTRGAVNLMVSDLRMVDASGTPGDTLGVAIAFPRDLGLRVPYAMGVACNIAGGNVHVTLVPADTFLLNTAAFSGYAWRDTLAGEYHYVEASASVAPSAAGNCQAGFTTIPGARVVRVSPAPGSGAAGGLAIGTPVMLHQRIRYELKTSATFPGQMGLWRTLVTSGLSEEIAAPFDTSAVFKFYVNNADTSQAAVPAQLSTIRGIDFVFNAVSERPTQGRTTAQRARTTTAVFFKNRLN